MPALLLLLALCVTACSHSRPAPTPPPLSLDQVLEHDPAPAEVQGLGPDASNALDAAVHDAHRSDAERAHALRALAYVPDAQERLRKDAEDVHLARELRVKAVEALFLRVGRAGATMVQAVLDDPDPQLRLEVAHALGSLGGPLARQVLEARLDKESDAGIREALQKSLTEAQP